jgi:formate hydrogenlyase subunit 4
MTTVLSVIAYLILAPVVGGLLAGLDRIVSARMQGRVGPPLFQPFYDVFKLTEKENITVNKIQDFYVLCFFVFVVITGVFFFAGESLLMIIFTLTLATVFLILAAFSSNSPYAQVGAERELLLMMAYEPMVLLTAIGFYLQSGSFRVDDILGSETMPLLPLIGIFAGYVYILTIKFRKSPFDLSTSHHGHQELVKGLTTEFSGKTLAIMEVAHWYENVFLLGVVFLFFMNGSALMVVVGLIICAVTYFFEVFIDNTFARVKWQLALNYAWAVALVLGGINLFILILG